ncbi:hypothetical protein BT96DRAFT_990285 [Gymnopus androsaceus JB14]|uniref:F-box domain-containing protein n=1 Tax=Gymnopus androsaceus JB14 TaxID=1447944 RepID=A0A6A4HYY3_9AGAR|nr:hypothetical protein BT96DRAFT_990285 [Gymnopus androsaceus JB14]
MPNLTCLELFIGPFIEYQISLMNLIQNLRNLRELVIPPFPDLSIILTGISNLDSSKLSDLKIYIDPGHDPTTTINLAGATASQVFVDHLHLEDTSFVSYDPASAAEIRELLSRIAQTCSTMEEVALSFENTQTEVINRLKASPAHIITFDVLRPLLSCSKIRSFEVDVLHPLSLDDADIELFAQSCPCLETLYLGPVPGILASDNLKKLSFRSLLHLALHCPQIRNLYLYLDAEHIPEGFENVSATATFTRLCYFGVGFSPIQDPAQVARVLASFLPPTVFFSWGPSSGQSLQWEDVDLISLSINTTWDQHWKAVLPSSDGANANDWKGKYVRGV